ncbi:WXG100 family type VII secretion target [Demequina litorisediminis]|uniref:WXG100 family type VII secretion target n=1 Tax=Demequina litorisediminis TaxID=1849022 RepID=A0ABQ6IEA8_9MICO|nr:WXG100 family type VII secretion target [Demequina litorisediminis]GMA36207.1 hypothetical protein GCM10025876_24110 [Demequina litorisediminis]
MLTRWDQESKKAQQRARHSRGGPLGHREGPGGVRGPVPADDLGPRLDDVRIVRKRTHDGIDECPPRAGHRTGGVHSHWSDRYPHRASTRLDKKVATLKASWNGQAQASYDEAERQWNKSISDLQQLLAQIANKTDEISNSYVSTDNQAAKRFSI